jgi:hypothetical protein
MSASISLERLWCMLRKNHHIISSFQRISGLCARLLLIIYLNASPSYLILICLGHIRDFLGKRFHPGAYRHLMPRDGYAPLNSDFDSFYTRRLKRRMDECFSQPVTGVAGRTIMLLDRYSPDYNATQIFTGTRTRALNISSYNYLGFAQATGGCADAVEESIRRYGISSAGSRLEGGSTDLHGLAEALVARFVGQEDALISSMVFPCFPASLQYSCMAIGIRHQFGLHPCTGRQGLPGHLRRAEPREHTLRCALERGQRTDVQA